MFVRQGSVHMSDRDQPATTELEAELCFFIRQDFSSRARLQQRRTDLTAGASDLNPLVARVASASIDETERVISKLKYMRDMLRKEGDRVQREVGTYVGDGQAMVTALQIVAQDLARQARR
jgi:hypothetical protein